MSSADLSVLVHKSMTALAGRRPIFQIRLEKRVANDPRIELDVLIHVDGKRHGLELKYPRSKLAAIVDGEEFRLSTGAADLEQHDVIKDLTRLERLVSEDIIDEGCVVVLTNARGIWAPPPP